MVDDWGGAARSRSVSAVIFASLDEEDPEDCSIQGFSLKSLWESRRVTYSTEQPLVGVECGVPMEEHSDGADRDENEVGCEESEGSAFNCSTRLRVSVVKVDITIKQRVIAKVCFRSKIEFIELCFIFFIIFFFLPLSIPFSGGCWETSKFNRILLPGRSVARIRSYALSKVYVNTI